MFFRSFRRTFLTAPARLLGGILFLGLEVVGPLSAPRQPGLARRRGLLLPGLLLPGHGLLLALPGAGVGLRALPVHGQPAAMPDALVAPDLDLAADVGLHLTAQVTFDLVVGVDPVPEPDEVVVAEVVHAGVPADVRGLQRLQRAGAADAVDVGKGDLEPLVTREVDADEACHRGQFSFSLRRSCAPLLRPCPDRAPASSGGGPYPAGRIRAAVRVLPCLSSCFSGGWSGSGVLLALVQPWRCLCRGSEQITMTRPCRRMIRHLLQIFFTLGLTFTLFSSGCGGR